MSDQEKRWQDAIESATACSPAADPPLDPEVAELRATWEALGRLLDAADQDFDAAALLRRLAVVEQPPRRHARVWAAVLATAALLLIAVTVAWLVAPRTGVDDRVATPEIVPQAAPQTGHAAAVATAVEAELRWDDPWEDRLAQVDRAIAGFSLHSYSGDASLQVLDEQVSQIGKDLNQEPQDL